MPAPEPIATGTLAKTPLPHLLVYLEQKKLSGTLAIWPDRTGSEDPGGQDRVLLLKGVPVAGKLLAPTTSLREGLLALFTRVNAPYAFYESNLLGDDRVSGRVDPYSLIAESLRRTARSDVVESVLGHLGAQALRALPGSDFGRYDLEPAERVVVDLLKAQPADIASLVVASGLPETRARRILYLLAITKAIAPIEITEAAASEPPPSVRPAAASAPPAKSASMPAAAPEGAIAADDGGSLHGRLDRLQNIPSPPDELSDELRQRWLRVVTKGRLIENQNYFEMLDIDREAKSSDARAKFYQMAKEWHPDRLPPELLPIREYVQIIFSYLSEANATLGDESQRVKYVQSVREGGGTPAAERLMQTILDTAMEYERVLVMSRKREWDDALELMKKILVVVKEEADYHAMYAWLLMQRFPGQEAPLQKMLESANRALELNDRHERANLLKAQILRRMGRPSEALEYFRTVVDINPRNVDAMREVRVASMRNEKLESRAPPKGKTSGKGKGKGKGKSKEDEGGVGGLLGKLFKK